ncbi:hypothetical protein RHMOL_Rhmol10G0277500 [Rhododendron molle]|uniref:Uncharacterized protein n=3 Tax=Rhododendron molle TaxID=49168 RepID=A0ACC0M7Z5_RHOML|nr:hypothetical protein RHMOL_Rhmol10G0277500 [Rhododendron molle]
MGLAATSVVLIPHLVSLFAAVPPVTAKLKTTNVRFDYFNDTSNPGKVLHVNSPATIHNDALQVTMDSVNSDALTDQAGRILYNSPFKLWEGQNDTDRVASFNASFLVNIYRVDNSTPGEGLTFMVAPDLDLPPSSYGEFLGLTNSTTDGDNANRLIAVELDTFKEDFDPDSNHVGLNINSVRSNITRSLTPLGFQLVGEGKTANFFNVWVQYDGIKKVIEVYLAPQTYKTDPTPPIPANPILTSNLELRGVVNQNSYFGFSASTSNATQLNCVLRWNLTVQHYVNDEKQELVRIGLTVGIPAVVLLSAAAVVLVHYFRKKMSLLRSNQQITRRMKSLPGMPGAFQYKDLQKATNNFDEKGLLGRGGCGEVFKGYIANEDLEVAVKVFLKGQDDFFSELTIINQLRHRHLVPLLGWCHDKHGKLLLVYEYMPNGSLDKHLFGDTNSKPLSWDRRDKIISGVASALHYLHNDFKSRVVHRDLKASNIMLDSNFDARLGDFGLARALETEKTSYIEAEGVPGTMGYMAPEYLYTGKATEQSDVYAFGAVLLEVICGCRPGTQIGEYNSLVDWVWSLHREGRLLKAVDRRLKKNYPVEKARTLLLLGLACSHSRASERPKTQEIVQILLGLVPVPHVPSFKPPFVPAVFSPESLNSMMFFTSHVGSGLTPLAIDLETQRPYSDSFGNGSPATTDDTTFFTSPDYGSGWTPMAINPEIQRPNCDSFSNG